MVSYQQLKSNSNAPIGTIMPWSGKISSIPQGWILCDGSTLDASEYPRLSKLHDVVDGKFRIQSFNNHELKNARHPINPSTRVNWAISASFNIANTNTLRASVNDLDVSTFNKSEIISIVPRILGVDHTPGHTHGGQDTSYIPSVDFSGFYAPVYSAPTSFISTDGSTTPRLPENTTAREVNTANENGKLNITPYVGPENYDRLSTGGLSGSPESHYTLYTLDSQKNFSSSTPQVPFGTNFLVDKNGATEEFSSDVSNRNRMYLESGWLPTASDGYSGRSNFYPTRDTSLGQRANERYSVLLNHNLNSENELRSHFHEPYFIELTSGSLRLQSRLFINNINNDSNSVTIESIPNIVTIDINTNSPGVSFYIIMKAY